MDLLNSLFSLENRVAVVTGASRGIGAAIARGLAMAGARVIGLGRSESPDGDGFEYRRLDVTDQDGFRDLCEGLERLDVLVNAAGISLRCDSPGQRSAAFARTLDVNLSAVYACCIAAADRMAAQGGGSIINVTSIGSVLGFPGNPGYVAAKGGLRMLSRALAVDLGAQGIRVNNLAPGYVRTSMTEASFADPMLNEQRRRHTALGRWGQPADLVGAAIFLAADASAYVTGQDLFVDGGWTAKGLV